MDSSFRNIIMHDIDLPPHHVMVGIGFERIGNALSLMIKAQAFIFATGKLIKNDNIQKFGVEDTQ